MTLLKELPRNRNKGMAQERRFIHRSKEDGTIERRFIPKEELLPEGWEEGKCYVHPQETRDKLSKSYDRTVIRTHGKMKIKDEKGNTKMVKRSDIIKIDGKEYRQRSII